MTPPAITALGTLVVVIVAMLAEWQISIRNERALRARGALEPARDVYRTMQVIYPLSFVAMIAEGYAWGTADPTVWGIGAATFVAAKLLKYWAIVSLGSRWTFRVLVPVGEPLVASGPYRWVSHPNYIAVMGELVGVAVAMRAVVTGPLVVAGFGWLISRRIAVENRALGRL